jgi:excisionase family DNA binding protein
MFSKERSSSLCAVPCFQRERLDTVADGTDRRLLTIKQAAEQLACSEANVYALVGAGQLPFVRVGSRKGLRIDSRDLDAFIQSRKVQYEQAKPKPPRPRLKHIKL